MKFIIVGLLMALVSSCGDGDNNKSSGPGCNANQWNYVHKYYSTVKLLKQKSDLAGFVTITEERTDEVTPDSVTTIFSTTVFDQTKSETITKTKSDYCKFGLTGDVSDQRTAGNAEIRESRSIEVEAGTFDTEYTKIGDVETWIATIDGVYIGVKSLAKSVSTELLELELVD